MWQLHLGVLFLSAWRNAAQDFPSMETWSYEYQQYWQNIIGASCSTHTPQSPIDIPKKLDLIEKMNLTTLQDKKGMRLGPFAWSLSSWTANVTLHPGPVTWEVQMVKPDDILVDFEGRTYTLQRLTFKSPSEHTVEGAHNAMEVQLHHTEKDFFKGTTARRLVVSVSFRQHANAVNGFLNPIFSAMPDGKDGTVASTVIGNPYVDLAPPDKSFVTYQGSTTVPPCDPATWVVFLQPEYIGQQQLEQFRSSISGYQPSRLASANGTNPTGVSELWDSRWGYNSRGVQDLKSRSLTLVEMANVDSSDVPKLNSLGGSGDTWTVLLILMLMALLATGCLLLLLKRIQNMQDLRSCCDESDEEEDVRQFQAYEPEHAAATLLSPLPDPYMHMAPARAGFAKHHQIYLG